MKKIILGMLLSISILTLTGCEASSKNKVISNGTEVSTSKMSHKHCTRTATAGTGMDVSLNYDLYYTGEILNILQSEEKVISASDESLDLYEDAYKKIHAHYEGLEYYDAEVIRNDTTVTSKITINYDRIDIEKLLEIEGEEDNVIEDGKAKVELWLNLAKKFGTTCEEVED